MNKHELETKVNEIIDAVKNGNSYHGVDVSDRQARISIIDSLVERFTTANYRRPDPVVLEKLADLILYEELTDPHPDKVTREEYPFMSEHQFEERHAKETSLKAAEERGQDGKDHSPPKRRKRTNKENRLVDLKARARNKEIAKKYRDFTDIQPIVTYTIEPTKVDAYLSVKYTEYQRKFA